MKKGLSLVLVLVVLLQLWGCGTTPSDSSTDSQESAISSLQEGNSELKEESQLESVATTVLSENETVAYVDGYIHYLTEFVQTYTDFLDDTNDNLSYEDIEEAENFWKEKLPEADEKLTQIKAVSFPDKYKDEYDTIYGIATTIYTVAEDLTKWDTNGDGAYTEDEINLLIHTASDSLRGLTAEIEKLRPILENDTVNETDMAKQIRENHEKTQSIMDNAKKCEVCGKTGSFELEGLNGATEYYCYEHYKEMKDIVEKLLTKDNDNTKSASTLGEKNALKAAKSYLDYTAFSYTGLIEQLEYEGYSHSEAVYGADNCGADWNEQAAKAAANYLDYTSFSRSSLIEQLEYEGFTHSQAIYGVEQNGY